MTNKEIIEKLEFILEEPDEDAKMYINELLQEIEIEIGGGKDEFYDRNKKEK